ncbi:phosphatidylinositol-glycan-specific phospholipase D-like isoform X2 [Ruditapes philippinarum]|uniref:phosphatidylinositol-glycan-specific phospholipase D-like isoform X2 n=1 Tax=Ruditapes philippinarum TaxID=129788 RepID=UPI00295ABB49|nr:phosphatidylinositol-glycan-specific phospholipase D-like isoform X2 [Ruditapes philippinarum]
MFLFTFAAQMCLIISINACGVVTHIEISHRAKTYFKDDSGSKIDYAKLIQTHNDALMAGSPYPDAFYDDVCANGQYHDVSEDTHWAPFLNASVNYINAKYPQPWDEATEKLVVFIFGIVSHQVADILWHSLGIDQGFLQAMANINFHGQFDLAHPVGDFGGDILTEYEMNTTYIPLEEGWYFPLDDLYNIYISYYGNEKIPKNIIQECTLTLFLRRLAEQIAAKELFPEYAEKSPFLVDQFEQYFIGGVDDMAGWTHRIWQETITMVEKGTGDCDIPKSTLFLHCNGTVPSRKMKGYRDPGKNGYFRKFPRNGISHDDIVIEKILRGIRIKPSKSYKMKLQKKMEKSTTLKFERKKEKLEGESRFPDRVMFVKNDYARLGEAYATGDLNFDGKPDLVVTAPGYGTVGSPQEGRVYIIYGDDDGIPKTLNPDLDSLEATGQGQILKGWGTAQSRFGKSIAVMDINLDGADDIAVGAPAYVDMFESPINYNGYVLIYFGIPKKKIVANGAANITIVCQKEKYCNLGYSMTSGDVNNDGYLDLVIGTPFAPAGGEQRGFVAALFADVTNFGYTYKDVTQLPWRINGTQSYGWFGYDMSFGKWNGQNVMFVSQPVYRYCYQDINPNCTYDSDYYIESVGQITAFYGTNLTQNWTSFGKSRFSETGWSADIGSPYPDKNQQIIAVSQLGEEVSGTISGRHSEFLQAGVVGLFNTTSGGMPSTPLSDQVIEGDRSFGRFGQKVKFWDINNDTMSDLFIGAPFRSEDFTERLFDPEQGQVYIFTGGEHFAFKVDCGNSLIQPCPKVQADYVLQWPGLEGKTRFGTNFAFLNSTKKMQVFVTAQHASDYSRFGGAIGIFDF